MGYGIGGYLAISKQNSVGTATSGFDYVPFVSESLTENIEQLQSESLKAVYDQPNQLEGINNVSGDIVFESPYEFQAYQEIDSYVDEFRNSFNIDHSYYFTPTDGRMLIFPSHLMHEVEENLSNEDRISVSFNIKLSK